MTQALRWHLVSTTGLMLGTTSIYTLIELFIIGMDPVVSLRARIFTVFLAYLGLGFAFVRLREMSRRFFHISDERSPGRLLVVHDLLYPVVFNAVTAPVIYLVAGASVRELLLGTAAAIAIALVSGPINGYLIDLSGELSGLRPSARVPARVRALALPRKQLLFVAIVSGFVAVVGLLYASQITGAVP